MPIRADPGAAFDARRKPRWPAISKVCETPAPHSRWSSAASGCGTERRRWSTASWGLLYSRAEASVRRPSAAVNCALLARSAGLACSARASASGRVRGGSGAAWGGVGTAVCAAAGKATIDAEVATRDGLATASYVDKGCASADRITASLTLGGQTISQTAGLTVLPAVAGSMAFVEADRADGHIALKGTGGIDRQEFSNVTFRVYDRTGQPVAGTVVDGDTQAMREAGFQVGDRVCALVAGGGYADHCVAPVGQCLPVPQGLSDEEAACLPETFFTVWSNVFDRGRLQAGETLLVQGGSSGIGVTAIQMAKALGARVIVTAGSDDKCAACLRLGGDHAINYKTHDFVQEAKRLTEGRGVDVVLDMVAGDYVAREVECLAEDGRLVIIAVQGGVQSGFNAGLVLRRRLSITGSTLRPRPVAFKAAIAQRLRQKVWPLIEAGKIRPVIHARFAADSADGAAQAHALMESNQHIGKIVLTW